MHSTTFEGVRREKHQCWTRYTRFLRLTCIQNLHFLHFAFQRLEKKLCQSFFTCAAELSAWWKLQQYKDDKHCRRFLEKKSRKLFIVKFSCHVIFLSREEGGWFNRIYGKITIWKFWKKNMKSLLLWTYWNVEVSRGRTRRCLFYSNLDQWMKNSVLRIHDILGWIRIRISGSMPLTDGSNFGSRYFRHWPSRFQEKTKFWAQFF